MPENKNLLHKIEEGIERLERRPVDRYLLGPFLIWYGLRSRSMGPWPRRLIISGGIFQLLYAWREYRKLLGAAKERGAGGLIETVRSGGENNV